MRVCVVCLLCAIDDYVIFDHRFRLLRIIRLAPSAAARERERERHLRGQNDLKLIDNDKTSNVSWRRNEIIDPGTQCEAEVVVL